jgi:hypothetical protein
MGKNGSLNQISGAVLNVRFVLSGQPVVYPVQRNVTALAGSQLSLAVEFCANPAASHAFWLTSSIVLMPGQQGGGYIAQNLTVSAKFCGSSHPTCVQLTFFNAALLMGRGDESTNLPSMRDYYLHAIQIKSAHSAVLVSR